MGFRGSARSIRSTKFTGWTFTASRPSAEQRVGSLASVGLTWRNFVYVHAWNAHGPWRVGRSRLEGSFFSSHPLYTARQNGNSRPMRNGTLHRDLFAFSFFLLFFILSFSLGAFVLLLYSSLRVEEKESGRFISLMRPIAVPNETTKFADERVAIARLRTASESIFVRDGRWKCWWDSGPHTKRAKKRESLLRTAMPRR